VKKGDVVYSYNLESNKVETGKVLNTLEKNTDQLYEISTTTQTIQVTADHPFYVVGKGWKPVKELKVGDELKPVTGKESITAIKQLYLKSNCSS
jgi:intein/homing endonuclease